MAAATEPALTVVVLAVVAESFEQNPFELQVAVAAAAAEVVAVSGAEKKKNSFTVNEFYVT